MFQLSPKLTFPARAFLNASGKKVLLLALWFCNILWQERNTVTYRDINIDPANVSTLMLVNLKKRKKLERITFIPVKLGSEKAGKDKNHGIFLPASHIYTFCFVGRLDDLHEASTKLFNDHSFLNHWWHFQSFRLFCLSQQTG